MTNAKLYDVLISPVYTEKATNMADKRKHMFKVSVDATKEDIKAAVEQSFQTEVQSVNTLNRKGKAKTFKGIRGRTKATKIAVVTLKEGKTIEISAGA
jgi:large subunit ribosomal protein L23